MSYTPTGNPLGRPSIYSDALADEIINRLEQGETLAGICRGEGKPRHSTVILWTRTVEGFYDRYSRAREIQMDVFADQVIEIADDKADDPNSRRIRVDARKWLTSKIAPKRYGEMSTLNVSAKLTSDTDSLNNLALAMLEQAKNG